MKNSIGLKIKTMRLSRQMTQSDLASELQVSRSTVGMWETGEREPNLDTIEALADIFNVPISALIDEKEKPANNDGLSENMQTLVDFVKTVPEEKAGMILRVIQSIVTDDSDSSSSAAKSGK